MPNIDERVVEMRFDNKQFERGVQTSLNTLSALKSGLDLNGAAKGLGELEKAGSKFSLEGMATAIDHISGKFSALGIAGFTVIQDLTRSALNMAKSIASQFTIDPIKTGFAEYETQINSVQTILANTQKEGTNLQQVSAALDELNKYADKTIYNFTEMTRNIGTFTAAGVSLDTSVTAIQGIANLAAISGSTSQQASTAMYQLSQALASGTVKLMDWNSVVNAGMGGQVFQDALMETARVHGISIDEMIKANGSFRETLQEGWLSADILTETLEKFTASTEGLTEAQIEQNRELWKARGYTDEQIDAIFEMGNTSTDAATKVKTFTQLMDTLKESAQSGWTQTWETLVGDFEEAKDLFTEISNTMGDMITSSADSRNERLFGGLASGWKQLLNQGIDDAAGFEEMVSEVAKEHGVTLDEWIKADGSFTKTLKRNWLDTEILAESVNRFTEKLSNMSEEELKAAGYTQENVEHMKALQEQFQNGTLSLEEFSAAISGTSGREHLIQGLRNAFQALMNIVNPIRTAFSNIFPPTTSEQIYAFTEGVSAFTEKLLRGSEAISGDVQTVFEGFFSVISVGIKGFKAFIDVAGNLTGRLKPVGESLFNLTVRIGEYFTGVNNAVDETNIFGKAVEKLTGFFGPLVDKASELVSGFFDNLPETVAKAITAFISFGKKVGEFAGKIGKAFAEVFSGPDFYDTVSNAFNTGIFTMLALGIKDFISSLKETVDTGKGLLENFQGIFDGITGSLEAMQQSLKADTLMKIAGAIAILIASITVLAFIDTAKVASSIVAIGLLLTELMVAMGAFSKITSSVNSKGMMKSNAALFTLATSVLILAAAVKVLSSMDWDELIVGLVGVGAILAEIGIFAKLTQNSFGPKQATGLITLAAAVNILALAVKQFAKEDPTALITGLAGVAALLLVLAGFTKATANAKNVTSTAIGLTILGAAMLVFGEAIEKMGSIPIPTLATGIIALAASLLIIAGAVNLMPSNGMISAGVAMLAISAAMVILSGAIETVGKMPIAEVATGVIGLGVALAAIVVAMQFMTSALPGAAALLVVAAALRVFVPALQELGSMTIGEIATGLIALALSLGIVGGAAALLSPVVPAMLGMAAALALVSVSVVAFGAGVALFAAAMTSLATVGAVGAAAIVAALTTIVVGIVQLIPTICVAIGEGIVAIASTIGASVGAICSAVTAVVTAVVSALVACIPLVVDGALQLIVSLLASLAAYAPQIIALGILLIAGLINGIASQLPNLIQSGINLMVSFINGMADGIRDNTDRILAAVSNLMSSIVEFALTALATLVSGIPVVGEELEAGILEMRDSVRETMAPEEMEQIGADAVTGLANGVSSESDALEKAGTDSTMEYINGLLAGLPGVESTGTSLADAGVTGVSSLGNDFESAGEDSGESFVSGLESLYPNASVAGTTLATKGNTGATSLDSLFKTSGIEAGSSFVTGISSNNSSSNNAGTTLAEKGQTGAASKDNEFKMAGSNAGKGFVDGITAKNADSNTAGVTLADKGKTGAASKDKEFKTAGADAGKGFVDGIASKNASSNTAGSTLADKGRAGTASKHPNYKAVGAEAGKNFVDGISSKNAASNTAGTTLADKGRSGTASKHLNYKAAGADAGTNFVNGISSKNASSNSAGATLADKGRSGTASKNTQFNSAGATAGQNFVNGVSSKNSTSTTAGSTLATKAKDGTASKNSNFKTAGSTAGQNFVDGVSSKNSTSNSTGSTLATKAKDGTASKNSDFKTAGKNAGQGFVDGAASKNSNAWTAGWNLAKSFLNSILEKLGIASPSREARKLGAFTGEGFVLGIEDMFSDTKQTSKKLATTSLNSMSKALSGMADFLSVDLDTMPTICPVMDLSEIQNGVSTIDKMFRATKGLDLSPVTLTAAKATSSSARHASNDGTKTTAPGNTNYNFTQNNYSPKALSRVEIYRQTKNQFSAMERMVAT